MSSAQSRIKREEKTVAAMIRLYCKKNHTYERELCQECSQLLEYAKLRLDRCPYEQDKPTCAKCPVHCYTPQNRAKIRTVMRFSGPRMLLRHPVLAIRHSLDGRRKVKPIPKKDRDG